MILDLKRELICKMPPIYCEIDKPLFSGDFYIDVFTWDSNKNDYVEKREKAYFDGKNFYYIDIYKYEATDWIINWSYMYSRKHFYSSKDWFDDVNKGLEYPDPKICIFDAKIKKYIKK